MTAKTPLHAWHSSHGGRMIEFGGWDMPVQYTTIVDEHQAVRSASGIFDISHMGRLSFEGPDALPLIEKVFTNSAAGMRDFQVRYGLVCNDAGGILDDVLVYRWPYGWAMVVNASNREKIVAWLDKFKAGMNVKFVDQTLDTAMIALQGPKAIEQCQGMFDADVSGLKYYYAAPTKYRSISCVVSRTGYTGEDGIEVIIGKEHAATIWEDFLNRGAKACGLGARDTLRLEAAMPLYGHELSETIDPFQAGLAWAVKLDKGDFLGRESLVRRKADPKLPRRVGLTLGGRRIAREGATVSVDGNAIGAVASGTFSPTLQKTIAMAYVDPSFSAVGTAVSVDVRGNAEAAEITALPFYSRKK